MKLLLAIVLAYLLSGISQVLSDLVAPPLKKPMWALRPAFPFAIFRGLTWPAELFANEVFVANNARDAAKAIVVGLIHFVLQMGLLTAYIWLCLTAATYVSGSILVQAGIIVALLVIGGRIVLPIFVWPLLSILMLPFRWRQAKRDAKQIGDANELEWLDELTQEHGAGVRDNRDTVERLIHTIEKEHAPSALVTRHLRNARRVLDKK